MDQPSQFAERMDQPPLSLFQFIDRPELELEPERFELPLWLKFRLGFERELERVLELVHSSKLRSQLFQLSQRMRSHERSQFFQLAERFAAEPASPCLPPPHSITNRQPSAPAGGMNQRSQFAEGIAADPASPCFPPPHSITTVDCQPSAPAGGVLIDPNALSKAFVDHYYTTFDTNRPGLANLYQDASMLTLEGERFQGAEKIAAKLASLPFQQCQHSITTVDCQPSGSSGGVLVFVSGILHLLHVDGGEHALKFSQLFLLMPTPQGSFYVQDEIFRVNNA